MVGFKNKIPGYSVYISKKKNICGNKIILPIIKRNHANNLKNEYYTTKNKIIVEKSEESGSIGENDSGNRSENGNEGSKDE